MECAKPRLFDQHVTSIDNEVRMQRRRGRAAEPGRVSMHVGPYAAGFLHEWGAHATGIMLLIASEGKLGAIASHMDRVSNS